MDATHTPAGDRRNSFVLLCLMALVAASLTVSSPDPLHAEGNGEDTVQINDSSGVGKSLEPPPGGLVDPIYPDCKWGVMIVEVTSALAVTGW